MNKKREIVALALLPLIYLYIMKLPSVFFLGLLFFISAGAQLEFYSMYRVKKSLSFLGIFAGLLFLYSVYTGWGEVRLLLIVSFLVLVLFRLFDREAGPEQALSDIAPVVVGFSYIPLILSLQIALRDAGPEWIIFIGATVWASDSFAYYIGKNFGKRKLYPSISPKKTIEGAVGSMAGGVLAGVLIKILLIDSITIYQVLAVGFLIGCIAVLGDLTESMFKRDSGVKDSSSLIPGHGGVLDKIDGMLFVTPLVYLVVKYVVS
ncbi:MAG: phosphatidate cytidylyltransferase [Nitrospirota bacterium]|nr:phosphatidate cytidylyltransferase [Nitrospirota bacterium]